MMKLTIDFHIFLCPRWMYWLDGHMGNTVMRAWMTGEKSSIAKIIETSVGQGLFGGLTLDPVSEQLFVSMLNLARMGPFLSRFPSQNSTLASHISTLDPISGNLTLFNFSNWKNVVVEPEYVAVLKVSFKLNFFSNILLFLNVLHFV